MTTQPWVPKGRRNDIKTTPLDRCQQYLNKISALNENEDNIKTIATKNNINKLSQQIQFLTLEELEEFTNLLFNNYKHNGDIFIHSIALVCKQILSKREKEFKPILLKKFQTEFSNDTDISTIQDPEERDHMYYVIKREMVCNSKLIVLLCKDESEPIPPLLIYICINIFLDRFKETEKRYELIDYICILLEESYAFLIDKLDDGQEKMRDVMEELKNIYDDDLPFRPKWEIEELWRKLGIVVQ